MQVQGAQGVLGDPWVAWEAVEVTEVASLQEGPGAPEGTRLEEETSSTELETGSAPIRTYCSWKTDNLPVKPPYPVPTLRGGRLGSLRVEEQNGGPDCAVLAGWPAQSAPGCRRAFWWSQPQGPLRVHVYVLVGILLDEPRVRCCRRRWLRLCSVGRSH